MIYHHARTNRLKGRRESKWRVEVNSSLIMEVRCGGMNVRERKHVKCGRHIPTRMSWTQRCSDGDHYTPCAGMFWVL